MFILQSGSVFSGSLTSGSSPTFLSIKFGVDRPKQLEFRDRETGEIVQDNQSLIAWALALSEEDFPIQARYFPHVVTYQSADAPSLSSYHQLVEGLMTSARKFL